MVVTAVLAIMSLVVWHRDLQPRTAAAILAAASRVTRYAATLRRCRRRWLSSGVVASVLGSSPGEALRAIRSHSAGARPAIRLIVRPVSPTVLVLRRTSVSWASRLRSAQCSSHVMRGSSQVMCSGSRSKSLNVSSCWYSPPSRPRRSKLQRECSGAAMVAVEVVVVVHKRCP